LERTSNANITKIYSGNCDCVFTFSFLRVFSNNDTEGSSSTHCQIVDQTGWLTSQELAGLQKNLKAVKQEGVVQIAVLIVESTLPETIEQFSIRVAEQWKVGKKGADNGLLVVIARRERLSRIEVGYGLEGNIPDLMAKKIIDMSLSPQLWRGRPYDAIVKTVEHVKQVLGSEAVTHKQKVTHSTNETLSEIPFYSELSSNAQVTSLVLGIIGGVCLLIGINGPVFELILAGFGVPLLGGFVVGLVFFTAQLLLLIAVSIVIALIIGLGITIGVKGGGTFGGGGASG
jgi:uncharacterized protein